MASLVVMGALLAVQGAATSARFDALKDEGVITVGEIVVPDAHAYERGYRFTVDGVTYEDPRGAHYCMTASSAPKGGEPVSVRYHPADPSLHGPDCALDLERSEGGAGIFIGILVLISGLIGLSTPILGSIERARPSRLVFGLGVGAIAASLTIWGASVWQTHWQAAIFGLIGLPVACGVYTAMGALRTIALDLDVARGAATNAAAVALKRAWGTSPMRSHLGRAALRIATGHLRDAHVDLANHFHLDRTARHVYGLVHGAFALADRGPRGARAVIEGLLVVPPLADPVLARYRAYVLARAAATAIHFDEGSLATALKVENELLKSKDAEVRAYAAWIREAREAPIEPEDDPKATLRAAELAKEAGLADIAERLGRRAARAAAPTMGAAYRGVRT